MTQAQITVIPEYVKCICLLFDKVYIKVSNKNTSEIIGFDNFGDVNNHLLQLEHSDTKNVTHHVVTKIMLGEHFLTWNIHMPNTHVLISQDRSFFWK